MNLSTKLIALLPLFILLTSPSISARTNPTQTDTDPKTFINVTGGRSRSPVTSSNDGGYFGYGGGYGAEAPPEYGGGWSGGGYYFPGAPPAGYQGGGGGHGWGYGGGPPGGGSSEGGGRIVRPTVVCKEKGLCYMKKLKCPARCFHSFHRSGKGYSYGGGGGGCTLDCTKCSAYC